MPSSSSDSGMSQSLGGMASMVGIEIGNSNLDKTKLANQILVSLDFYKKIQLQNPDLLLNLLQ